jgi:uncharacterized membrane protein YbhN (UPF0104 family)
VESRPLGQALTAEPSGSARPVTRRPGAWRDADIRVFSSASDAARARRPTDLLLLLASIVAVALLTIIAPGPTRLDGALKGFIDALPGLLGWFWEISYDLLVLWALFLLGAALVSRRRKRLLLDQVLAGLIAFAIAAFVGRASGATWSSSLSSLSSSHPPAIYPAVRLAITSAVIVTASPHLGRPLRYLGRWILALGAVAAIAVGVALPIGVAAAFAAGVGAAAFVHLLFGSPGGRLPLAQVARSLDELGVTAVGLEDGILAPRGAQLVAASTPGGRPLLVKIYGRDAWNGQLLAATWSSLWFRDGASNVGFSRVQQVEHEAFVTLLAERNGVPVRPVIAAGLVSGRDALLVIETAGRPLSELDPGEVDDDVLHALWSTLDSLHDAGIAHGQVDGNHIVVCTGAGTPATAALLDLADATVAAPDSFLFADRARLLVTTALAVGNERAIAAASAAIGPHALAQTLPFLQPAALDRVTRRAVHDADWDLGDLRSMAAASAGVDEPKLEQIKRVTWGSLLMVAVLVLAAYFVISAVAGVGLQNLIDQLQEASPGWLIAAFLLAPTTQVAQAFSTMGASERPVRLGPVILLQSAIQFLALAVPSSAARIALNIRFFQRVGATTTAAVAIGLIDSVSGFLVQVLLLLTITLSGLASLNLSLDVSKQNINWRLVTFIVVVLVIAVVVVGFAVPKVRAIVRSRMADATVALRVLHSPSKVLMLFFGNLVEQLLFAFILGLCLRAFGYHATFAELILVNTVVCLFAGFMPVPGGIGVAEAAFTACFVALGIPQTAALATAITYRLVTYYLPPIWGAFSMKWLRTHEYV